MQLRSSQSSSAMFQSPKRVSLFSHDSTSALWLAALWTAFQSPKRVSLFSHIRLSSNLANDETKGFQSPKRVSLFSHRGTIKSRNTSRDRFNPLNGSHCFPTVVIAIVIASFVLQCFNPLNGSHCFPTDPYSSEMKACRGYVSIP